MSMHDVNPSSDENRKKANGKPSDATGVLPPDDPSKEEKVAGVNVWAGNSSVEEAEMLGKPLSNQEEFDTVHDSLAGVNRHSFGTRYSEIPPVETTEGGRKEILDVPIDADIPPKQVDYRDGDARR